MQYTLARPVELVGTTLHRGLAVRLALFAAPAGTGRRFVRSDLDGEPTIPAVARFFRPSALSTTLEREDGASVQTVEHLLAALYGLGIDDCRIVVDGPELPILDGSARPYLEAIERAGLLAASVPRPTYRIAAPVTVYERDAFVSAVPTSEAGLRLSYGIDFPAPIGQQWFSLLLTPESFAREVAPARTFTMRSQIQQLLDRGLIQGGSLACALVADTDGWIEPPAWPDEPARHKLLDLLGDLSLTGVALSGHVIAYKAGHALHGQLAHRLFEASQSHFSLLDVAR